MPTKNGPMRIKEIIERLRCGGHIRKMPAAILLWAGSLLFICQLHAQDLLLKEYIYLDGRLLAVERQVLAQTAQLQEKEFEYPTAPGFTLNPFSIGRNLGVPGESNPNWVAAACRDQSVNILHYPASETISDREKKRSLFVGREHSSPPYGFCLWPRKIAEIANTWNGGGDDEL
jgi:hypothetical protein